MTVQNKTNLVLLIIMALILGIGCSSDNQAEKTANTSKEGEKTANTNKDNVGETGKNDETPSAETETPDDESDDSEVGTGPTTVRFAKGRTSKTYKTTIAGRDSHTYYLNASSGQTMSIVINSPRYDAGFTVYNPAGNEISAAEETTEVREFSEELSDSGRYTIVVASPRELVYDITFEVSAKSRDLSPREAEGGANKTVRFGKGNSSASYSNSVIRGDRDTYILGARAGQFMTVSITSVENNASFQIVGPNGEEVLLDDTYWRDELPANGNYKIIVGSGRGNATYTIKFTVEQSPIDH